MLSRSVMPNSLQPLGLKPTRLLCPWDFPGKNTGLGCHDLLQGIFLTQRSNPLLLHCRQILYHWATRNTQNKQTKKLNKICVWGGNSSKESTCQCKRHKRGGSIPGSGRSPGEGSGSPLQYSCLGNPMDRGVWWATVHGSQRVRQDWRANSFTFSYLLYTCEILRKTE